MKAGTLLVEIEPTETENALDQSRAAIATAEAGLQVARSNLESARANLLNQQALLARAQAVLANDRRQADRLAELFGKGLVSAQDRDNARTAYEASQAAVSAQEAQVEVARVQIATTESQVHLAETQVAQQRSGQRMAQMRLDDTQVVAPFSGFISEKRLEVGASVSTAGGGDQQRVDRHPDAPGDRPGQGAARGAGAGRGARRGRATSCG